MEAGIQAGQEHGLLDYGQLFEMDRKRMKI